MLDVTAKQMKSQSRRIFETGTRSRDVQSETKVAGSEESQLAGNG